MRCRLRTLLILMFLAGLAMFAVSWGIIEPMASRRGPEWIKNEGFLVGIAGEALGAFGVIMVVIGGLGYVLTRLSSAK